MLLTFEDKTIINSPLGGNIINSFKIQFCQDQGILIDQWKLRKFARGVEPFEDKGWRKSAVIRQFLKKGKFWTSGVTFLNRTKSLFIHFLIWRDQEGTQTGTFSTSHLITKSTDNLFMIDIPLMFRVIKDGFIFERRYCQIMIKFRNETFEVPGSVELRTNVFAVHSFALFGTNNEQCEQRTVRTVHIVRTVNSFWNRRTRRTGSNTYTVDSARYTVIEHVS